MDDGLSKSNDNLESGGLPSPESPATTDIVEYHEVLPQNGDLEHGGLPSPAFETDRDNESVTAATQEGEIRCNILSEFCLGTFLDSVPNKYLKNRKCKPECKYNVCDACFDRLTRQECPACRTAWGASRNPVNPPPQQNAQPQGRPRRNRNHRDSQSQECDNCQSLCRSRRRNPCWFWTRVAIIGTVGAGFFTFVAKVVAPKFAKKDYEWCYPDCPTTTPTSNDQAIPTMPPTFEPSGSSSVTERLLRTTGVPLNDIDLSKPFPEDDEGRR